jgi:energy-coupling factor transport system permease protein
VVKVSFVFQQPNLPPLVELAISWFVFLFGATGPIVIILAFVGIRGFLHITRFESGEGILYRLSPLTKLVIVISITVAVSLTIWWFGAILTLVFWLLFFTLNEAKRKVLYVSYLLLSSILGVSTGFAFYTPYSVLQMAFNTNTLNVVWVWPSYFTFAGYEPYLTLQALYYGLQITFRFTAPMLAGLLLVLTTTPSDLMRYLAKVKFPLPFIFALTVAMRTVPRIFDILDTVVKLQLMRGLGYGKPAFLRPFYVLIAALYGLVPTLIFLMKGAKYTAIAADTRAFNSTPRRTYMKEVKYTRADYVAWGLILALYVSVALLLTFGYGRGIPYVGY